MPFIKMGYEQIFHEEMGIEAEKTVENMFYVGFATFFIAICSFLFNILAGRILGPSVYGKFTLIQSIALFLSIPMLMGFETAMVKYSAEIGDFQKQRIVISTAYLLVFFFTNISLLLYFLFLPQILAITSFSKEIFQSAIILSVLFVFFTLTINTLRGLHEMKKFALLRPVFNIILLSSFLVFIIIDFVRLESMLYSMYLGYGFTALIVLIFFTRRYLGAKFDRSWADKLIRYSAYAMIGGVASVIYSNVDLILIDKFLSIVDVGIYGAYHWAFITFSLFFSFIFITVLFPLASKYENKEILYRRVNRIIPIFIIVGFPIMMIFGFIILGLFGKEYPFDFGLAIFFGLAGVVIFIDGVYGWLMNAIGSKGVKITSLAAIVLAGVNILLNICLIPLMGLNGAIIAKVLSYAISIIIIFSKRRYFFSL